MSESPLRYRSAVVCGHCCRTVGDVEWDPRSPRAAIYSPAEGRPRLALAAGRIRCGACGGPGFAEPPELVQPPLLELVSAARAERPARRTLRAS